MGVNMAGFEKLLGKAKEHLEAGEEVISGVKGGYETKMFGHDTVRDAVFLATNRRLILYSKKLTGHEIEIFPYSAISSIELSKGLMGHKIVVSAAGNKATMKWIKKGEVKKFVSDVKIRIGKKEEKSQDPETGVDIPNQIKKLAELKDQGILSEEEFETKKKELLAKL